MNWLKDFFFCNTWRELFVAIVVGAIGLFIFWFLIVAVFVLFGQESENDEANLFNQSSQFVVHAFVVGDAVVQRL